MWGDATITLSTIRSCASLSMRSLKQLNDYSSDDLYCFFIIVIHSHKADETSYHVHDEKVLLHANTIIG